MAQLNQIESVPSTLGGDYTLHPLIVFERNYQTTKAALDDESGWIVRWRGEDGS